MPATPQADALPAELLAEIAAQGGARHYPAHTVLINEGDDSDAVFLILSGRVKAYGSGPAGREVIYDTLGPGECVGEMSLDGGPRSASVMTLEPTTCVLVSGKRLRELLAAHPEFALHLMRKLIRLARHSTQVVKRLALHDVRERVLQVLEELAQARDGARVVSPRPTQQELADRVGASREMVSRVITQLAAQGRLRLEAQSIVLISASHR